MTSNISRSRKGLIDVLINDHKARKIFLDSSTPKVASLVLKQSSVSLLIALAGK